MISFTGQTKEQYRYQIIEELANNKTYKDRVEYLSYINSVSRDTFISEDVYQTGLWWVCKMRPEKVIELYEKSPKDLMSYAVHIAWKQGLAKPRKGSEAGTFNPKHSVKYHILHNSSFNQITQVNTVEIFDPNDTNVLIIFDGDLDTRNSNYLTEHSLLATLEPAEFKLVEEIYYAAVKRRGKRSKILKAELVYIQNKLQLL